MIKILLIVLLFYINLFAFLIDRDNNKKVYNSYYVFPAPVKIEGIGKAMGIGVAASNIGKTDIDFAGVVAQGDFDLKIATLFNVPLYSSDNFNFVISPGYFSFNNGGATFFTRGRDSKKEDRLTFGVNKYKIYGAEVGMITPDEQLEFYVGFTDSHLEPSTITDINNNVIHSKIAEINSYIWRVGAYLDDTNNRRDPRLGYRVQIERMGIYQRDNKNFGDGYTDDISITAFIPIVNKQNVLVVNWFKSMATITRKGEVHDEDYICNDKDKTCSQSFLNEVKRRKKEDVLKGNSTSLGGTNRLRSYPKNRFYDTYTAFIGYEYRMYLLEQWKPFNAIFWKGVSTGIQLAFFREYGQVNETDDGDLYRDMKTSTGVGIRLIFSNAVFRIDWATGAEGDATTIFYGYSF